MRGERTPGRDNPTAHEAGNQGAVEALGEIFEEIIALFLRLRAAADELHGQGETSGALRGLLRDLDRHGPQTVPQLARRRWVSRQDRQVLVNRLEALGLVELVDNPAHKRSRLVRLTPAGEALVAEMSRRETALLERLTVDIPPGDLRTAVAVLRSIRQEFDSGGWRRALETGETAGARGRTSGEDAEAGVGGSNGDRP